MVDTKTEAEKKTMRGYLLGDLSDEEKAGLEERFLSDGAYFEQLSALEEELIEAYVHRELEEPDRERFEQYFMQSPVQRARVERTAVLFQALESARRAENRVAATPSRLQNVVRLRPSRRAFGVLLAAAALLIALVAPWLLIQQTRMRTQIEQSQTALQKQYQVEQQLRNQEQQLREQQKQASAQIAQLTERLKELSSPQLNSLIHDVYPSRFARTADGPAPNELTVPPSGKTITLLLHSTSRTAYPTYRLEIRDAANNIVWQGDGLARQSTGEYVVTLPSKLLSPGGYTLQVYAPSRSERAPVESYRIRIATPR